MRLTLLVPKSKPAQPPSLCVPSAYCLRCPVQQREAVCFFKRPRPDAA